MPTATRSVDATLTASRALLGVVARSVAAALEEVTLPQFRVLVLLSEYGPTRVGALAERMGALPSTFSRSVDRMVAAGWVERTASPDSRREVLVSPTARGYALVDEVTERRRREIAAILARMEADERRALGAALHAFAEAAGEIPLEELVVLGV